jgi:peptidoglycan/xylan/chitin deacetylase (PgdA/CDA1 family)
MSEKKYIALTFDDGRSDVTGAVLDKLDRYGIKATFFLIGNNITPEREGLVLREYREGHEINNHSLTHSDMTTLTEEEVRSEIQATTAIIQRLTGHTPAFFRPPYIAVNDTMCKAVPMPFIAGIGANDWMDEVSAEERAQMITEKAEDGVIILLHDAKGNVKTVEALDTIIPNLLSRGFEFVTLTSLFEKKGVLPVAGGERIYSNILKNGRYD